MKVKDIIKKQTTVIALAVVLVTITVIGISYAIFFDIHQNENNQVVTAGTLKMTLTGASAITLTEPKSISDGMISTPVTYTISNQGNLPAKYSIYIYGENDNTFAANQIRVSLDGETSKLLNELTPVKDEKYYPLVIDATIDANKTETTSHNLRVWIDEDTIIDDLDNAKVALSLYIVSEVNES